MAPIDQTLTHTAERPLAVFLVEDEALIRMMIAEMVEELGHRVVAEAGDIERAITLAQSKDIDLAILDINIAQREIDPVATLLIDRGIPIVFASGYGEKGLPKAFAGRPVLQKPFLSQALAEAICKVLVRPSQQ